MDMLITKTSPSDSKEFPFWKQSTDLTHKLQTQSSMKSNLKLKTSSKDKKSTQTTNDNDVLDMSDRLKKNTTVLTEWGTASLVSINKSTKKCEVKVEGQTVTLDLDTIKPFITVYMCIVDKIKTHWGMMKIGYSDTTNTLKKKIALLYNVNPLQVVLVHNGCKIKEDIGIFEMGLFEFDDMLVVIKDKQ